MSSGECPLLRALGTTLLCLGQPFTSGCGTQLVEFGGSGGGTAERAAPTVISSYPANAASGVALDTALSATFSDAMDAATLNATSFTLSDGSTLVSGAVALDEAAHTATFTLAAGLSVDTVYTASITTGARNVAQRALDADYAWGFDTLKFNVVASEAAARAVPVPDYTLSVAGLELLTDAHDSVQSATGTAVLTAGVVTGQTYVVSLEQGLDTYAEVDAAYGAAAQPLVESIPTTTPATAALPASAFTLLQADLTTAQLRTLIIGNSVNAVRSYQLFAITFNPAVRAR